MIGKPSLLRFPNGRASGIAALSVLLLLVACEQEVLSPELEFAAAQEAAEGWVQRHASGWSIDLRTRRSLKRPEWSEACVDDPDSGFTTWRYTDVDTEIDLHFRCPLAVDAGVDELAEAFEFAVLEELPHGIRSPGWRFRVLTPSSHVREAVTLSSPTAGRLLVEINTPLFAISGHSTRGSCQPLADMPSPEGCYLRREYAVPLHLSLEVPLPGSAGAISRASTAPALTASVSDRRSRSTPRR